jgi:hypothetical protein
MLKVLPKTELILSFDTAKVFFCCRKTIEPQSAVKSKGDRRLKRKTARLKSIRPRTVKAERIMRTTAVSMCIFVLSAQAATAATIWEKANEIMKDVYNQILLITTVAAIVTASVALLLMNFSRSGRIVDESRSWLKRIIVTWAVLNSLGFIMAWVTPFFSGGQWS